MSCAGMGLNDLDDSREGFAKFLARNPDTCFAALDGSGRIAGTILAGNDGRRGYLYHTAVHPAYRGRGIARRLVREALEALRACGIHRWHWLCLRKTKPETHFGKSWGSPCGTIWYTETGPLRRWCGSTRDLCLTARKREGLVLLDQSFSFSNISLQASPGRCAARPAVFA